MIFFCDFETRSEVDIKTAGAHVYAAHPSTDVLCMGWAVDDGPVQLWVYGQAIPTDLLLAFDQIEHKGSTVVAHNAPFELAIWNSVCVKKYGWPLLKPEQVLCTMARSYAMGMPGSLEKAVPAAGIKAEKDMAGNRVMLQISQPKSVRPDGTVEWYTPATHPEKFDRVYKYCMLDVDLERQLFKRQVPLSESERQLWILDQKINNRGVRIDVSSARVALELVELAQERLHAEMRQLTGNQVATCTATAQLRKWLSLEGIETESVDKATISELLARKDLTPAVRRALILRQEAAKSSTGKIAAMIAGAGVDGRIRGTAQYHGANTGRWAGRRLQLQNFPRPNLPQEQIESIFKLMERA